MFFDSSIPRSRQSDCAEPVQQPDLWPAARHVRGPRQSPDLGHILEPDTADSTRKYNVKIIKFETAF